jgi:hypothetical protein
MLTSVPSGLEIKERKRGIRTIKRCFVGSQFIDWLIAKNLTSTGTRQEAVAVATALLNSGEIKGVTDVEPVFQDKSESFYVLSRDDGSSSAREEPPRAPLLSGTQSPRVGRFRLFGASLQEIMARDEIGAPYPRVITLLTQAIVRNGGLNTEGIFRISPESMNPCSSSPVPVAHMCLLHSSLYSRYRL